MYGYWYNSSANLANDEVGDLIVSIYSCLPKQKCTAYVSHYLANNDSNDAIKDINIVVSKGMV